MKTLNVFAAIGCTFVLTVCSADAAKVTPAPTTEEQKTLYALGLLVSRSLTTFDFKPEELAMVQKGITDGVNGVKPPLVDAEGYIPKVQALQTARVAAAATAYLTKAAADPGATKTASGIVIKHTKEGTGAVPAATDTVKVHYEGRLIDGFVFDSSIKRGEPAEFPLNQVIGCWTEGVQTIKVGGKAQLTCPASLAYGERGSPPNIPPGATLVFDVELLDIVKPPAATPPAK
jgi:FKBP-type peptidyl-prolyl cis-trans isomerase FkpA/FKBP-type peptidyl-prolyl cis-trans isomerase FklB